MKTLLAVSFLWNLAGAPSAAAQEGAGVSGPACCHRPMELIPRGPQRKSLCSGTLWSHAQGGRCVADHPQKIRCEENAFETLVTVREYSLSWDEKRKECILTSTGKTGTVQVPTCDGNSC